MTDRAGVRELTCEERDAVLHEGGRYEGWRVESSLTDAYGEYGEPIITTTWGRGDVRVKDVRHPHHGNYSPPDRKPCEHYTWTEKEDD